MIDEVLQSLGDDMDGTIESLHRDLGKIRAGRAQPSLLDSIMVDYYGTATALNKLATVSAPEARMLLIQPFDQGAVANIEKAIRTADLGLSPINDGKLLRVPIPELTEERRRDLVRQVRKEAENHRVSARNHRRDANDLIKELLSDKEVGEDEARAAQEKVQTATDDTIKRIDEIVKAKEADIMAV